MIHEGVAFRFLTIKRKVFLRVAINPTYVHPRRPRGSYSGSRDFRGRKFTVRMGRAPRQLLLPNQFQKHLNSPAFDIFLPNQQRGPARRHTKLFSPSITSVAWAFIREDSRREFQKKFSEVEEIANFNMATGKQTLTEKFSRRTYRRYRSIVNF